MASQNVDHQSTAVEPKSKKLKLDQSENNINADCPLFRLPDDILAKIIGYVPITQWPDLELVSTKFRDVTYLAWRSLRRVNLDDDFKYEPKSDYEDIWRKKFMSSIERVLEKLLERAPFIKSLEGVRFQVLDPEMNTTAIGLLSKFENLEAISFTRQKIRLRPNPSAPGLFQRDVNHVDLAIRADDFVTFIESTRSRTKLKEIFVAPFVDGDSAVFLDSFADRVNSNEQERIPLEKLVIRHWSYRSEEVAESVDWIDWPAPPDWRGVINLLDTSTLTSLSLGSSVVEPELLSELLQSATNLHHLGFAFACCKKCNGHRLDAYQHLMKILATRPAVDELHFFKPPSVMNLGQNCWEFEAEFMQMLKSVGPRLHALSINLSSNLFEWIFDVDQIAAIVTTHMPALESIQLPPEMPGGSRMRTADIKNIVRLQTLEDITLVFQRQRINTDIIATIGQSTCLKSLRLFGHVDTPENRTSFMGLATLTTLIKLEIENASSISTDVLVSWGNSFGSTLEELRLSEVSGNAHPGLIDLIKKANRLRILEINHHESRPPHKLIITNGILDAVAASCPNLEQIGELIISENNIHAIQNVIDACPKLKDLRAKYVRGIDHDSRAQLEIDKYRKLWIH